jgi:hypothetical protein
MVQSKDFCGGAGYYKILITEKDEDKVKKILKEMKRNINREVFFHDYVNNV